MLAGMTQATAVAAQHANNAKALQEPMINAENEFNRIMQLLSVPMISLSTPGATMAKIPNMNTQIRPPQMSQMPTSPYSGAGPGGMQVGQYRPPSAGLSPNNASSPVRQAGTVSPRFS